MTFSPDGGAGAKVREQLKSSGTVPWGPGVSTLNVIPICLLLGERQQKKEKRKREKHNRLACVRTICDQKHLCNILRRARRRAREMGALPSQRPQRWCVLVQTR